MQKRALLSAVVAATAMSFVGFAQAGVSGKAMVYTPMYPDIVDNMCKPSCIIHEKPHPKSDFFAHKSGTSRTILNGKSKLPALSSDFFAGSSVVSR